MGSGLIGCAEPRNDRRYPASARSESALWYPTMTPGSRRSSNVGDVRAMSVATLLARKTPATVSDQVASRKYVSSAKDTTTANTAAERAWPSPSAACGNKKIASNATSSEAAIPVTAAIHRGMPRCAKNAAEHAAPVTAARTITLGIAANITPKASWILDARTIKQQGSKTDCIVQDNFITIAF